MIDVYIFYFIFYWSIDFNSMIYFMDLPFARFYLALFNLIWRMLFIPCVADIHSCFHHKLHFEFTEISDLDLVLSGSQIWTLSSQKFVDDGFITWDKTSKPRICMWYFSNTSFCRCVQSYFINLFIYSEKIKCFILLYIES